MAQHFAGTRSLAFVIRSSKIQGMGAFATRRIRKGERIIEYLGECIDEAESDIRYPDDEMGRHHTFLFSIGDGSRVLDAGPLDWPAKYINHSCDPNCEAIEEEDGRVFISALRKIEVGTELLYDYAYERTDDHTDADEQLYVCRCGSPKCRGSILAPLTAKDEKKAKKKEKKEKAKAEKRKKDKKDKKSRAAADAAMVSPPAPEVVSAPAATKRSRVTKAGSNSRRKSGTKAGAKKTSTRRGTTTKRGTTTRTKTNVKTKTRSKAGTKRTRTGSKAGA
ncbi:MAG: SET domain-containing protein-lysine N-methyltransferase [Gemmatimonadota bacterium]